MSERESGRRGSRSRVAHTTSLFPAHQITHVWGQIQWPLGTVWYLAKAESDTKRRDNGAQGKLGETKKKGAEK